MKMKAFLFSSVFAVLLSFVVFPATAEEQLAAAAAGTLPATALSPLPEEVDLQPGEIRSYSIDRPVSRILIANPTVLDVRLLESKEILLQAKASGSTKLLLWDERGQQTVAVNVFDTLMAEDFMRVLAQVRMPGIELKREREKYFLVGQVANKEEMDRLNEVLAAFGGKITSLVTTAPPPPPPPPQPVQTVKLTVQLVEMTRSSTDGFGVDWQSSIDGIAINETLLGSVVPSGGIKEAIAGIGESLRLGRFSRSAGISGVINLLISKGKARILSEPKLVAGSGKKATTRLGVEFPIVTSNVNQGVTTQEVEFKNVGVDLAFEPVVLPDGDRIQLSIQARVTSIASAAAVGNIPSFRVRETNTEIFTKLGETVVIAGLLQDEERKTIGQVPGIGSIPGFGNLFRSTDKTTDQTELVVLITPDLLTDVSETADRTFELEQSLARAELSDSVNDPVLRYVIQVQDRVAKALRYPQREKELGLDGRVKLKLHLFRDGTLGQATIAESSGIEALDMEALKAAESQAPYPPFPADLPQPDLWVELPVLFRP